MFCNAKKLKTPERDAEYENIRKDYFKVLDDAGNCHKYLIILWLFIIASDLMKIKMKKFSKPTKCMIWLIVTYVGWTKSFTSSKWSWKLITGESQKSWRSVCSPCFFNLLRL